MTTPNGEAVKTFVGHLVWLDLVLFCYLFSWGFGSWGKKVPWWHTIKMLITKLPRATFPRRSLVHMQPGSAVPGMLPQGSVYPTRNKFHRFDSSSHAAKNPWTRTETGPLQQKRCQEPQTREVCLVQAGLMRWAAQGQTWNSHQQAALCIQSCLLSLNTNSGREK